MSMLLYNTLTRTKEKFSHSKESLISLYVCGITPNNATHLGHAFTYVSFDVLLRFLRFKEYNVKYLQNYTDINDSDDVIKQAREQGKTWEEIAQMWVAHFKEQMKSLNVIDPDVYKPATSAIDEIIKIIEKLLKDDIAYNVNGTVYFDISKFKKYGELSKFTENQMITISKDRGNDPTDPNKRNPLDFVLWKGSDQEPFWDSPFGKGRPGWHIECSALNLLYLGEQITIHGGGRDLIYPHHESEIAQSESYTKKSPFSKIWMHTAMVIYEGEKMSKSLGNLVLVQDVLKKYSPNVLRWYLLCHHYRQPWEYVEADLRSVEKMMAKIERAVNLKSENENYIDESTVYEKQFINAMEDDLNTPAALEIIRSLSKYIIANEGMVDIHDAQVTLSKLLGILGFTF